MKACDHRVLTRKAIEIFHKYSNNKFSAQLVNKSSLIEDGSEDADTSPIITRITNWHFFKQNDKLQPKTIYISGLFPLPVTPTSEVILAHRVSELTREFKHNHPHNIEDLIGRILHHIQDMSTPSHVVPVYHGPKLKDSFEEYSSENIEIELQKVDITKEAFDTLISEINTDLISIYTQAAFRTLHHLYDNPTNKIVLAGADGATRQIGWNLFWELASNDLSLCSEKPFDDIPGFGCFGPLGDKFGKTSLDLDGKQYDIMSTEYAKLYRWVLYEQISNSLKALMAIYSLRMSIQ